MVIRNRTKKTIVGQTVQWSYEIGPNGHISNRHTMVQKTIVGQTVQWSYEIGLKDNRRTDSTMVIRNRT